MKMNYIGLDISDHQRTCIRRNMGLHGMATRKEIRGLLEIGFGQIIEEQVKAAASVDLSTLKYKTSKDEEEE